MVLKKLTEVSVPTNEYEFSDLYKSAKFLVGVKCKGDFFEDGLSMNYKKTLSLNSPAKKLYVLGREKFVYSEDKKLYLLKKGRTVLFNLEKYETPPELYLTHRKGKETVVIRGGERTTFYDGNYCSYDLPKGNKYLFFKNKLIIVGEREVYVSGEDPTDKEGYSTIKFDLSDGKILNAFILNGKLVTVEEHNVHYITLSGAFGDYTIEEIESGRINVMPGTAVNAEDQCYFVNDGKLSVLKNRRIVELDGLFSKNDLTVTGNASFAFGTYLLPVSVEGTAYLYAFDKASSTDYFIKQTGYSFSEGYAIDRSGAFYKLGVKESERVYVSDYVTYGNGVGLKKVKLTCDCPVKLTVGGSDEKTTILKGKEESLYLYTDRLKVKLEYTGTGRSVGKLKLVYEKGE